MMMAFMLQHARVLPSPDMRCMGWVSDGQLVICVAFDSFLGKSAQIHVAFAEGWTFPPREMLLEVFRWAFDDAKREILLGVVNSNNAAALRFDRKLGFKELHRIAGMHEDGGDIVLLGMTKADCRAYYNQYPREVA